MNFDVVKVKMSTFIGDTGVNFTMKSLMGHLSLVLKIKSKHV